MRGEENWEHHKTMLDGERFEINGVALWDNEWKNTGERIEITDPIYGQPHTFTVYEITSGPTTVKFAAGEFSNCVWGIYVERK